MHVTPSLILRAAASLFLSATLISSGALAQSQGGHQGSQQSKHGDSAFMKEAMAAMQEHHAMMMSHKSTGSAAHDFLHMMIPHHKSAIAMAEAVLRHGDEPEVEALARKIIRDQEAEIRDMEAHLERHGHGK